MFKVTDYCLDDAAESLALGWRDLKSKFFKAGHSFRSVLLILLCVLFFWSSNLQNNTKYLPVSVSKFNDYSPKTQKLEIFEVEKYRTWGGRGVRPCLAYPYIHYRHTWQDSLTEEMCVIFAQHKLAVTHCCRGLCPALLLRHFPHNCCDN